MENPSDDIILPEADAEIHVEPPTSKPKKTTAIIIISSVVFLALAGALIFIIIRSSNDAQQPEPTDIDHPTTDTFKYDNEFVNDIVNQAEENIKKGDYLAAREALISQDILPERMTASQKYRYYSALASLYGENALNEPKLYERYDALAAQNLEAIRKGE